MSQIFKPKSLLFWLCFGLWLLWAYVEAKYESKLIRRDLDSTNILELKANYRVTWLDTVSGRFGGNLTLVLPTFTSPTPYWTIRFLFADQSTQINEYWGEWTMERYKSGTYVILPVRGSNSSTTSYCFNAQYAVHNEPNIVLVADLITPSSYTLIVQQSDNGNQEIPLIAQKNYTNTPLDENVPTVPFGSYIRTTKPQPDSHMSIPDIRDFGDGTTIQNTPVGLYIYGLVFFIGAGIVGAGTFRRSQFRAEFRSQSHIQKQLKVITPQLSNMKC